MWQGAMLTAQRLAGTYCGGRVKGAAYMRSAAAGLWLNRSRAPVRRSSLGGTLIL